jgi:catechol 2,3-dioxygenase-like lactoylglutathione lyase family enzyme
MKSVEIISVPVTDPQKSKEFYLKMGLNLVREMPFGKNQTWIQLSFPNGGANITLVNWFDKMPAGSLQGITISCEDIEEDIIQLNNKGIPTGKVDETPWGKFASITDPDGNSWSLHEL